MAKYNINPLTQEAEYLAAIANELAEANRLKRLELRMRITENDKIKYIFSETIDELEDLA